MPNTTRYSSLNRQTVRTSNIEHRTSNIDHTQQRFSCSMLDVRLSALRRLIASIAIAVLTGCTVFEPAPPPPPPPAALSSANQSLTSNMPDAAIADSQASLREAPSGPFAAQAWYIQGRAYELKVSDTANEMDRNLFQAHSCYLQALGQSPPPVLEGDIHASLCNVTFFQEDFAESIRQATAAIPLVSSMATKSDLLYRKGVCQQRLGEFTDADLTFRQVEQKYPGTQIAESAHQHEGLTNFYVQLATFSSSAQANQATLSLSQSGVVISQRTDAKGQTIIDYGPVPTYADAKKVKMQLAKNFPQALIVP